MSVFKEGKDSYGQDVDSEVIALCEAISSIPGLRTTASCCGHGKHPFSIWFRVDQKQDGVWTDHGSMALLLYFLDTCHTGRPGWSCVVSTDCGMSVPSFRVEGPTGNQSYKDAEYIAQRIQEYLTDPEGE